MYDLWRVRIPVVVNILIPRRTRDIEDVSP